MGSAIYAQQQGAQGSPDGQPGPTDAPGPQDQAKGDDDVVEAEIVDDDQQPKRDK